MLLYLKGMSAVCNNKIMKYLNYHSWCICKIYLFSNKSLKWLIKDFDCRFKNIFIFIARFKSRPATYLRDTVGIPPSKYGHTGTLIIFLLLNPRLINRGALDAVTVMSTKSANQHCSWRGTFQSLVVTVMSHRVENFGNYSFWLQIVFCVVLRQKSDYLFIHR